MSGGSDQFPEWRGRGEVCLCSTWSQVQLRVNFKNVSYTLIPAALGWDLGRIVILDCFRPLRSVFQAGGSRPLCGPPGVYISALP